MYDAVAALLPSLAPLAVGTAWCLADGRRQYRHHHAERRAGLARVRAAFRLLINVQQHRGMAVALLNGDQSFRAKLPAKQREVDDALTELLRCWQISRVHNAATNWADLRHSFGAGTVEQCFERHTALAGELLDLVATAGEAAGLDADPDARQRALGELVLGRLPVLTESLGQARALGSAAAAAGRCTPVNRVRLMFLDSRIRDCLEATVGARQRDEHQEASALAACLQGGEALRREIRQDLLAGEAVTIAAGDYFRIATAAIEAAVALHGLLLRRLEGVSPASPAH